MRTITKKHILASLLLMAALVGPVRTECFSPMPGTRSLLGNVSVFITTSASVGSFFGLLDSLIDHKNMTETYMEKDSVPFPCEKYPDSTIKVETKTLWKRIFIKNIFGRKITKSLHALHTTHPHVSCDKKCPLKDKQNCPFLKKLKTVWDDPTKA